MFERAYRQRLDGDLARWQADGVISAEIGSAIRNALPPLGAGVNVAVVVGILGGLLIAAAFLAFVAANWTEIARPLRFAILLAGIVAAYGTGTWFARGGRAVLADLCASVGSIVFGAAIALVGQMYHLGDDFAAGMLLWASGALAAAALTGSRGALAVALAAGSLWSGARAAETPAVPHLPFIVLWLLGAGLALAWQSRVAVHLLAVAALAWWIAADVSIMETGTQQAYIMADGAALLLGAGLLIAGSAWRTARPLGLALSAYGSFALTFIATLAVAVSNQTLFEFVNPPTWATGCGVAGALMAFATAAAIRRAGPALAGVAIAFVLAVAGDWIKEGQPWLSYALALTAMLCLVVSGMLDAARSRIVAGWLGLAAVIAAITWAVRGSLLRRSIFLAVAGAVAVALAFLLSRLLPKESHDT